MKLPKVPFLILIDHADKENIIKYEKKLFELGAVSCVGGSIVFTGMISANEGICVSEVNIMYFSNRRIHPQIKAYTMEEFDAEIKHNAQIEFDF
jgi:hypothetical protein